MGPNGAICSYCPHLWWCPLVHDKGHSIKTTRTNIIIPLYLTHSCTQPRYEDSLAKRFVEGNLFIGQRAWMGEWWCECVHGITLAAKYHCHQRHTKNLNYEPDTRMNGFGRLDQTSPVCVDKKQTRNIPQKTLSYISTLAVGCESILSTTTGTFRELLWWCMLDYGSTNRLTPCTPPGH